MPILPTIFWEKKTTVRYVLNINIPPFFPSSFVCLFFIWKALRQTSQTHILPSFFSFVLPVIHLPCRKIIMVDVVTQIFCRDSADIQLLQVGWKNVVVWRVSLMAQLLKFFIHSERAIVCWAIAFHSSTKTEVFFSTDI